jgi:hypothetical protein
MISKPNQKQRKGRVGRAKPGTIYYTYSIADLNDKVVFNMCISNVTDIILGLISDNDELLITKDTDPYLCNNLSDVPPFLQNQYLIIINDKNTLYNGKKILTPIFSSTVYPYRDGKYDISTVIDREGKLFIVHPNEDNFIRKQNLNIIEILGLFSKPELEKKAKNDMEFLLKNSNYTGVIGENSRASNTINLVIPDDYKNKVELIINRNKNNNFIDANNKLTKFGKLVIEMAMFFDLDSEYIILLLNIIGNNYNTSDQVFINLLLFIVFRTGKISIKSPDYIKGNSDYLITCSAIPLKLFTINVPITKIKKEMIFDDIVYNFVVTQITTKLNYNAAIIKNYSNEIRNILKSFYLLKFRIDLLLKKVYKYDFSFIGESRIEDNLIRSTKNIKSYNEYEQTCYFIAKNFRDYILVKVPGTEYYINYFDMNVNNIYKIASFNVVYYNKTVKIIETKVKNSLRNNIIFSLQTDDNLVCKNCTTILWIPENIISLIIKESMAERVEMLFKKNLKLSLKSLSIEDKKEFYNIYKKIDKFTIFIDKQYQIYK